MPTPSRVTAPPDDLSLPSIRVAAGELTVGFEVLRLLARSPALRRVPQGEGRPVVVIPGLGTADVALAPLRRWLGSIGHDARPAGLGVVGPDVASQAERMRERVVRVAEATGQPVALVGWSIGGVIAREVARDLPDRVRRVVTLGTPVIGGPTHTRSARRYTPDELAAIRAAIAAREAVPIAVPVTALWSRRDGIVAPGACHDRFTPDVEHLEVRSTHVGFGVDPDVWRIVADRLARPDD